VLAGGADVGDADGGPFAAADAVPVSVADWGPSNGRQNAQMIKGVFPKFGKKRPLTGLILWTGGYSIRTAPLRS
jgi:hypothetical protein